MTEDLLNEPETPEVDPNVDYYKELVGEGKKFKTNEDLAKGKHESDQYIKILERRLDEMREDYKKARDENVSNKRLEDLINQLSERPASSEAPKANVDNQPAFDPKQLESLVSSKIQEHEASRQQTANFNMVKDRLRERYGNNYKARLQEQIDELGISEQELNDMARRQPKVLMRTLELDRPREPEPFRAPPPSRQRADNFAPSGSQKRTWTYYQELKKKDPSAWFNRETAVQMQKDALELGDAFYDGNFYVKGLHDSN